MVVVMQERATDEQVQRVISQLVEMGFDVHRSTGALRTVIGAVGGNRLGDPRLLEVLDSLGVKTRWLNAENDLEIIPPANLDLASIDEVAARRTRSIIMFLGPLMHRMSDFELPYAGGCSLGTRTVEPHMTALRPFGLQVKATEGSYHANVSPGITPRRPIVLTERGDTVTAQQLSLLIGMGRDPVTGDQLGRAFPHFPNLAARVAARVAELSPDLTGEQRTEAVAQIEVEESTNGRQGVAGFDYTFSVPKSVSAVWGVSDAGTQALIVEAHHHAVADVLDFMEREVCVTRRGVAAGDGAVMQALGERKAELVNMEPDGRGRVRLEYRIPARGLIGFQNEFLNLTRGTGLISNIFDGYEAYKGEIAGRRNGVLISNEQGDAVAYAMWKLEDRGPMMIEPGWKVYRGMIVGEHTRDNDLEINVLKGKQLTNIRTTSKDEAVRLTPPIRMTLEKALAYIGDDELVEITPKSIRLRKKLLDPNDRKRAERAKEAETAA